MEKARKALEDERKAKAEDEERERKAWEDRRNKIEKMKAAERADREKRRKQKEKEQYGGDTDDDDNDDDEEDEPPKKKEKPKKARKDSDDYDRKKRKKNDSSDDDDNDDSDDGNRNKPKPKGRRKRDEPKAPKKDYKIFFSVNIQTDENDEDIIGNTKGLRPLLADLFETRKEKDVFQIKTRKKGNGFKIDFGIIIATSMHPADYIDTFDDMTMDGSFQEAIKDGFEMDDDPHVHIWEARYEKIDPKKRKKRKD